MDPEYKRMETNEGVRDIKRDVESRGATSVVENILWLKKICLKDVERVWEEG